VSNLRFDFAVRSVLVTGAARGIGKEIARLFADAGAVVYLMDADADEVARAAEDVRGIAAVGDVACSGDAESTIARVVADTGRLDVLVNNAGILRDAVLWRLTDDDWDAVLAVHLSGTFKMSRAAVPVMRSQGAGRIINVTSYSGLHGNVGQANYAAAKAGVIGLTKTVAKELAKFGVTVNAISPNADTRMIASLPDDKRAEIAAGIPLQRFADPAEMATAVAFLASDEAAYVTGVVLPVDGGLSI
jgi:3-oxoacyl-[acyl-carrier protein] reductase